MRITALFIAACAIVGLASLSSPRPMAQASSATQLDRQTVPYGSHDRQAVEYFAPGKPESVKPPLIAFIHGGAWMTGDRTRSIHHKARHFTGKGYAFASIGYRVLPDAPVEEQAHDIAKGLTQLRRDASALGFDPDRIVLMGHSAGAHLAALVSTDPSYLGDTITAIDGAILLDGAGYDVTARMAARRDRASRAYSRVFGDDPDRQAALSPVNHAGSPDAGNWLILHVADRRQSTVQSNMLRDALLKAGTNAKTVAIPDSNHSQLNRNLGLTGDFATQQVDAFLEKLF